MHWCHDRVSCHASSLLVVVGDLHVLGPGVGQIKLPRPPPVPDVFGVLVPEGSQHPSMITRRVINATRSQSQAAGRAAAGGPSERGGEGGAARAGQSAVDG